MGFIPAAFGDFGKKAKDLLGKKYDFGPKLTVTNKSTPGVTVETGAKGPSSGYAKVKKVLDGYGPAEVELNTNGAAKGSLTLEKLMDNVEVKISGDIKGTGNVEAKYKRDMFAGSLNLGFARNTTLSAAGSVGSDGVTVGGSCTLDLTAGAGDVDNLSLGCEYQQSDLTASLVATNNLDKIQLSWFQKVSSDTLLGASFAVIPDKDQRVLTVGTEYKVDSNCVLKGKADNNGIVSVAVEQILSSPALKLGVAASFDANQNFDSTAFGINFNFGDY
jgi:voltage-dependent anion channel protein 2